MSAMMQLQSRSATLRATTTQRRVLARRPVAVVRASSEDKKDVAPATSTGPSVAQPFSLLNSTNEAINSRAAMLGVLSGLAVESVTHHSVFSQLAGKYVDQELVEKAYGGSLLGFGAIVALVTLATLAPRLLQNQKVDDVSVGPFTPAAEVANGRAAMIGFAALLIIEAVKGSSLL